jgi:hypothetical protein
MGDAGYIIFGPIGREVLAAGTILFAAFATGSQLIAGQLALASLSHPKLCLMLYTGIFTIPTLIFSFPRTLDRLSWLSILSVFAIPIAGIVGMIGAGVTQSTAAVSAYSSHQPSSTPSVPSQTPVFAYAGHFMLFILISEMRYPEDAMKAAYVLQGFATTY